MDDSCHLNNDKKANDLNSLAVVRYKLCVNEKLVDGI